VRRALGLLAALALLPACPEQRGDSRQRIPSARVPPAVPVEAPGATGTEPPRAPAPDLPAARPAPTSGR
jgi:hypothetical protein